MRPLFRSQSLPVCIEPTKTHCGILLSIDTTNAHRLSPAPELNPWELAHYFDWCPEAVVLLHANTHHIVKGNQVFHHGVGPLSSVSGVHVLDALFSGRDRDRMAQALLEAAHAQVAITVLDCATSVWGCGDPLTRCFDWVVTQRGCIVVLSGRLSAVMPASPVPCPPPWLRRDDESDMLQSTSLDVDLEEHDGPQSCGAAEPPVQRHAKSYMDSVLEGQRRCFALPDVARKIQEARQFAELKAYGELLRQKDAFVERIFHEIRTPCHTLQMITQSLVEQLPIEDSELKCQLEMAWAQGVHICQLADDVKRAMLLQAGQPPPLQRMWVPLASVLHASQGFIRRLFPKGDVTLQVHCDSSISLDQVVFIDIDILSTVLCHLLTNAMKFTDSGHVTLDLRSDGAGRVTFGVTNPGPQLSEEAIRQLGQKYWQAPGLSARTNLEENHTGCGLGLHISFHYVRLMGGQLQVQSTPEATTFSFSIETELVDRHRDSASLDTLPASVSQHNLGSVRASTSLPASTSSLWTNWIHQTGSAETSSTSHATSVANASFLETHLRTSFAAGYPTSGLQQRLAPPEELGQATPQPRKARRTRMWGCLLPWARPRAASRRGEKPAPSHVIPHSQPIAMLNKQPHLLVVEDNLVCQKVVCRCLDQAGITYAVAPNGRVACEWLAADGDSFSLVLMDLRMPVMDGIAATQHIRQKLQCKLPIVVFSAEVGETTLEQVALAGATDLLQKPATPRMVLDMIYKHCPYHFR